MPVPYLIICEAEGKPGDREWRIVDEGVLIHLERRKRERGRVFVSGEDG